METLILNAKEREAIGNQVKALRRSGQIPAVVYGHGVNSYNVSLDAREIDKVYSEVGESALVDLVIEDKKTVKVLIQAVQYHPIRHEIIHADLRAVRMDEKIEAYIEFNFVGEAPAVKAHGAIFVRNMDGIDVKCLPTALVQSIDIDLGMLKEIGDTISVGDIAAPPGVEFLAEPDETIAVANEPAAEEVETGAPEADVASVQVAGKEAAAEGAEGTENGKTG